MNQLFHHICNYDEFIMRFDEWVDSEINKRGWTRREAARRGDISQSMLNKVVTGEAQPGLTFYRGIAKAFDISLLEVLIQAGEVDQDDLTLESLNDQFSQLPEWQQKIVLRFIESLVQGDGNEKNTNRLVPATKS